MPELPEVETIKKTLEEKLRHRKVSGVEILLQKVTPGASPEEWERRLVGRKWVGLERRGKYLVLEVDSGDRVIAHLGMTGRLLFRPAGGERARHTHVVFHLEGGHELHYVDPRQFGRLRLAGPGDTLPPGMASLGIEPLSPAFTAGRLAALLRGRGGRIKSLLLNQSLVAGLGNIYADEVLFRAGIHPLREASSLSPAELARLHRAIRETIREAIRYRGTTIADYVDGEGQPGGFAFLLRVYGREGQACTSCGEEIQRLIIGGRSSHFCPRCQQNPPNPCSLPGIVV